MITEITSTDIQYFVVKEVANSTEFNSLVTTLLGKTMNYYRGADLKNGSEATPSFTAYKFNSHYMEEVGSHWIVQFVISIDGTTPPITDSDGIIVYEDTDKVEQLAVKAYEVIKSGLSSGSLGGICTLHIADANILTTEIGEADDVQAIVTLRFEDFNLL